MSRPERYILQAVFGPHGFVRMGTLIGSQTFDEIWRGCPDAATHMVLQRGPQEWFVTDRFRAHLLDSAHVELREFQSFADRDSAMMAAAMCAARGSARSEFAHLARDVWVQQKDHTPTDKRAWEVKEIAQGTKRKYPLRESDV